MIDANVPTDDELWERFRAVLREGEVAWPALLADLEPEILAMARRQKLGRLLGQEDTPREIVMRVFARLHAKEHAAIKRLCAADPPMELRAWLRVLVRRSAIDYMRGSPEFERATPTRPNRWVSLATLTSLAPAADPSSLVAQRELVATTVREMVERATTEHRAHGDTAFTQLALEWKIARIHVRRLATKGEQFLGVLAATLEGHNHTEIAARLSLTRREVELTVRYLEEMLQARLAT